MPSVDVCTDCTIPHYKNTLAQHGSTHCSRVTAQMTPRFFFPIIPRLGLIASTFGRGCNHLWACSPSPWKLRRVGVSEWAVGRGSELMSHGFGDKTMAGRGWAALQAPSLSLSLSLSLCLFLVNISLSIYLCLSFLISGSIDLYRHSKEPRSESVSPCRKSDGFTRMNEMSAVKHTHTHARTHRDTSVRPHWPSQSPSSQLDWSNKPKRTKAKEQHLWSLSSIFVL